MNIIEKFVDYLRSSRQELTKVTWPSKDMTTRYSILVITVSLAVAVFFGALDYGLTELVNVTIIQRAGQSTGQAPVNEPIVPTTVPLDDTNGIVQPEFDFGSIEVDNPNIEVEALPIEE